MLLHDLMDDAVADVTADLPALAATSRRRGVTVRRRRRAVATAGATAVAAIVAIGVLALAPGDREDGDQLAADPTVPAVAGLSGETAPSTARGVAAALADAVTDRVQGTVSSLQGAADAGEAMATLLFRPEQGPGPAGTVFLNLQPIAMAGEKPYDCDAPYMTTCTLERLPDGDILRTYREEDDTEFGQGSQRLVAEVISRERGLRLVVYAMNTSPSADGVMRSGPVLTSGELRDIATLPWWSRSRLPVEYVEAGKQLEDYADAAADEF
ncbi:MAG TPA: hypothetical protein VGE14_08940 [Marmoricola sp.]